MLYFNNVLDEVSLLNLEKLIDNEISNFVCIDVPLHQSYNNMHIKHKENFSLKNLINFSIEKMKLYQNKKINVTKCWFNVIDEKSINLGEFGFHTHNADFVAVFYLKNCVGNGTVFKINNANLQLLNEDNSIIFYSGNENHTIMKYDGRKRYSIAMNFNYEI
jgi:hypothetical protein